MAHIASPAFLNRMRTIYLEGNSVSELHNSWYLFPVVAFSSSNIPEAVPAVFQHALNELHMERNGESLEKQELLLARRFRESIFKAGMVCGYSRVSSDGRYYKTVCPLMLGLH